MSSNLVCPTISDAQSLGETLADFNRLESEIAELVERVMSTSTEITDVILRRIWSLRPQPFF